MGIWNNEERKIPGESQTPYFRIVLMIMFQCDHFGFSPNPPKPTVEESIDEHGEYSFENLLVSMIDLSRHPPFRSFSCNTPPSLLVRIN